MVRELVGGEVINNWSPIRNIIFLFLFEHGKLSKSSFVVLRMAE